MFSIKLFNNQYIAETDGNPVSRGKWEEKFIFSRAFHWEMDKTFTYIFPIFGKLNTFSVSLPDLWEIDFHCFPEVKSEKQNWILFFFSTFGNNWENLPSFFEFHFHFSLRNDQEIA